MKSCLVIIGLVLFTMHTASAQFGPLSPPAIKKPAVVTQAGPGLQSPSTRPATTPATLTNADYALTAARVNIGTGADNKESLSNVSIELAVRNTNFQIFSQNNITNELPPNSTVPVGLEKSNSMILSYNPSSIPTIYYTATTGTKTVSLADVEQYGLGLRLIYKPNFFADAWKIEKVSVTLEFRDAKGNLHPAAGQRTITFTNTSTFLDNFDKRILLCTADGSFNPLTSFVTKDFSKRW
jgi:hypothetical protein